MACVLSVPCRTVASATAQQEVVVVEVAVVEEDVAADKQDFKVSNLKQLF